MRPSGCIVLIGASGGIGKAIVKQAINAGFTIVGTARNEQELLGLQQQYGENKIIPYVLDLKNFESFPKFKKFIQDKIGEIDWLIHAAGFIDNNESDLLFNKDVIKNTFEINVGSIIALSYLLLPLIKKGGGIISLSSTAGLWGNKLHPIYAASKGALNTFMQSLAKYLVGRTQSGITICPGPTNTEMRERIAHDAASQQSPETVASVITNILKGTSSYKNGDVIIIRNNLENLHAQLG